MDRHRLYHRLVDKMFAYNIQRYSISVTKTALAARYQQAY